ncbi:MAG: hypothetical protein AAB621_02630 [Patescibacteria group bacterium]
MEKIIFKITPHNTSGTLEKSLMCYGDLSVKANAKSPSMSWIFTAMIQLK